MLTSSIAMNFEALFNMSAYEVGGFLVTEIRNSSLRTFSSRVEGNARHMTSSVAPAYSMAALYALMCASGSVVPSYLSRGPGILSLGISMLIISGLVDRPIFSLLFADVVVLFGSVGPVSLVVVCQFGGYRGLYRGSRCTGVVGSWYSASWRSKWAEGGTIECQVVACSVERDEQCEAAMRVSALYVASTSGRLTALSIGDFPFNILWFHELEVPVFGSLAVTQNGIVICCLVDGHVLALKPDGSILWKRTSNGPIFAGACISFALPCQVLVCSRNGSVYSIELKHGDLVWEYNVGDPITASAYVDELVCICSSSGGIYVLRVNLNVSEDANQQRASVEEFGRLNLTGDIFSSPVMIGGRIFVGCRDDYLHCVALEIAREI
ncbi:putative acyl-activating enzyme 19 isoform X1 [Senna tora]|uniref:Putative acyl-activating enzyme 19 isoform X1 n=1 Tax=Senna tora TaxID=362788 RepID=A0A834SNP9_9FABA|nr:putative acyl-activating enzyme 19 isoform X1 [Senna tora]